MSLQCLIKAGRIRLFVQEKEKNQLFSGFILRDRRIKRPNAIELIIRILTQRPRALALAVSSGCPLSLTLAKFCNFCPHACNRDRARVLWWCTLDASTQTVHRPHACNRDRARLHLWGSLDVRTPLCPHACHRDRARVLSRCNLHARTQTVYRLHACHGDHMRLLCLKFCLFALSTRPLTCRHAWHRDRRLAPLWWNLDVRTFPLNCLHAHLCPHA